MKVDYALRMAGYWFIQMSAVVIAYVIMDHFAHFKDGFFTGFVIAAGICAFFNARKYANRWLDEQTHSR